MPYMEIAPTLRQETEKLFKQQYLEEHPNTVVLNPEYTDKCVNLILDCVKDFSDEITCVAFVCGAVNALVKNGYSDEAEQVLKETAKQIIGR
jgi:hypothetical protein